MIPTILFVCPDTWEPYQEFFAWCARAERAGFHVQVHIGNAWVRGERKTKIYGQKLSCVFYDDVDNQTAGPV